MSDVQPYEVISTQDGERWTHKENGKTFQSYDLTAKNQAGETVLININRAMTSLPPSPSETLWLEVWETERGLKGRKKQGPRGAAPRGQSDGIDHQAHPVLLRRHAQDMALRYAGIKGETDLQQIERWTQHFEEQAQRASGAVQGNGSPITAGARDSAPAPPQAPNGERKISEKQITGFILRLQQQRGISDENMALLVKSFGVEKLKDLPMSQVDRFAKAMADPIPDGSSDVPAEPEPPAPADDEDDIPF